MWKLVVRLREWLGWVPLLSIIVGVVILGVLFGPSGPNWGGDENLDQDHPHGFDRDRDGIGCESG